MNKDFLAETAQYLTAPGKGILAMDESTPSANKRFAAVGVEETEENRRMYRELLVTTPAAHEALSGVILYDETFWQTVNDEVSFPKYLHGYGILPGIKVDEGLVDFGAAGEQATKGLEGLAERMAKYKAAGARFAKWRAVIKIDSAKELPTDALILQNASTLADYARICQEHDVVAMVEPEVLLEGTHSIAECEAVMIRVYNALFAALKEKDVYLPGVILKTSMVLPGKGLGVPHDAADVALRTARTLKAYVPADLGGVVFLSGGQSPEEAMENLNAISLQGPFPWGLTFSYSRALQEPVLAYWAEHRDEVVAAQEIFARQLNSAVQASKGILAQA